MTDTNLAPTLDIVEKRAEELSGLMKLLAHPNRLMIACELSDGERSVSELEKATGVRQPVLSRELARLREAGMVTTRREAKAVFYRLTDRRLHDMVIMLRQICKGDAPVPPQGSAAQASRSLTPSATAAPPLRRSGRVRLNPDPWRKD